VATARAPKVHERLSSPAVWAPGGWLRGARHCPSPNCGERPTGTPVELALIHSISLPPGRYGGNAIERLFTNRLDFDAHPYYQTIRGLEVSSHFLLRRDGELLQFVGCDERAWHAGRSEWRGRMNCNDFSVGIELEGLEGLLFEPAQYRVLASLLRGLALRYPIGGVAGHEHVAPGRKHDPGAGFDWVRLASELGWPARYFPEGLPDSA
jgi:N-acetyl-anhydromuramoyl-L-alanine amidase